MFAVTRKNNNFVGIFYLLAYGQCCPQLLLAKQGMARWIILKYIFLGFLKVRNFLSDSLYFELEGVYLLLALQGMARFFTGVAPWSLLVHNAQSLLVQQGTARLC